MANITFVIEIAGAPDSMPIATRNELLHRMYAAVLDIYGNNADDAAAALHAFQDGHEYAPRGIYWTTAFEQAQQAALQGTELPAGARFVADYLFNDTQEE